MTKQPPESKLLRGRTVSISLQRRIVIDLMRLTPTVADVAIARPMQLGALVAAREALPEPPAWTAIFVKAMALVADEFPALRRTFVKFPRAHFYEYAASAASVTVERELDGEPAVLLGLIDNPSTLTLSAITQHLRYLAGAPLGEIKTFRRALKLARLPGLLRRAILWCLFQSARQRAKHFGSFIVTGVSALGADTIHARLAVTSLLHYGPIGADGKAYVHLVFDHRVFDGLMGARILARLEQVLTGAIVDELRK